MDPSILYSRVRLGRGRRLASPVRISLAPRFGGTVDDAWWPAISDAQQATETFRVADDIVRTAGAERAVRNAMALRRSS